MRKDDNNNTIIPYKEWKNLHLVKCRKPIEFIIEFREKRGYSMIFNNVIEPKTNAIGIINNLVRMHKIKNSEIVYRRGIAGVWKEPYLQVFVKKNKETK